MNGGGFDTCGPAAKAAGDKVERAEKTIVAALQRQEAALKAGGKNTADYLRYIAEQKGVAGTEAFQKQYESLKRVEEAQKAANGAMGVGTRQLNEFGQSAKATSAALRQVPAQFTDIVVSLQGGQAPMTVLLQQGGQLKDVFGGIVPAARALGGYIAGLVNPFTAAGAAAVALGYAYYQGSEESKAFTATLITTGNQAGTTAGQMMLMAQAIDSVSGRGMASACGTRAISANSTSLSQAALHSSRFTKADRISKPIALLPFPARRVPALSAMVRQCAQWAINLNPRAMPERHYG